MLKERLANNHDWFDYDSIQHLSITMMFQPFENSLLLIVLHPCVRLTVICVSDSLP